MRDNDFLFPIAIFMLIFGLLTGIVGHRVGTNVMRTEAVKAGVAEWVVNSPDGSTVFRWKTVHEKEE